MASTLLSPDDSGYPVGLEAIGAPPLYLRGTMPRVPGVAIVGTREPSAEAVHFARALARALCEVGFAVWSGGARGIDAAAHAGALDARGPTVVVCAGGHGTPYPPEHAPLYEQIVEAGGALLSRMPDHAPHLRQLFLSRNRVLAAATVATVVVEAGVKSGARSTAAHARKLGVPLCVVPHPPWSERGAGCAAELVAGARPLTRLVDLLAAIDGPAAAVHRPRSIEGVRGPARQRSSAAGEPIQTMPLFPAERLPPTLETVLQAVGRAPTHIDEVCEIVKLTPSEVLDALLTLTLQAVVVEGPAGSYRRV